MWAKHGGIVNVNCAWVVKFESWGWRKKCDEHKSLSLQKVEKEKNIWELKRKEEKKKMNEKKEWKMNEENGDKWNELGGKI